MISFSLSACQAEPQKNQSLEESDELSWEWLITPGEYDDVFFINPSLLAVKDNNEQYFIVDTQRNMTIPIEYDDIYKYYDDIYLVTKSEGSRFINTEGNYISDLIFEDAYNFSDGVAAVKIDGTWNFIDTLGNLITNYQFEQVNSFRENLAAAKLNGKWGFINATGKIIIDFQFDNANDFYEGYAGVMSGNKWGFVDREGLVCIDFVYDQVGNFSEDKASVKIADHKNGLDEWAYIDKNNNVVIDYYPYDASEGRMIWVGEFENGLSFVSKSLYCIIDDKGNDVFSGDSRYFISSNAYSIEYDAIPAYIFTDEKMIVKKYGLVGLRGNQRLEPVFDYVSCIYGDFVIVENIIDGEYKPGIIKLSK